MANENGKKNGEASSEKKGEAPVFERRLKDIRVACWRNEYTRPAESTAGSEAQARVWYHVTLTRTWRKGDELHEAPGSLNGLADIALAIAALEAAQQFIERQSES
jgi:hypothetical protein